MFVRRKKLEELERRLAVEGSCLHGILDGLEDRRRDSRSRQKIEADPGLRRAYRVGYGQGAAIRDSIVELCRQ